MSAEVTVTVREISHRVRIDLPDRPVIKMSDGRRRKLYGLRLEYGIGRDVHRVDIVVEFRGSAEHFPPSCEMPEELREIIAEHRPADVNNPDADRRTGMGGWNVPTPALPEGDVPGFYDSEALHALVVRGLRAVGFSPENAGALAMAHQQDAFDRAGAAIEDEAWPHERPESENQALYRLADKVRRLPVRDICDCGREKQPGENHALCYPGME